MLLVFPIWALDLFVRTDASFSSEAQPVRPPARAFPGACEPSLAGGRGAGWYRRGRRRRGAEETETAETTQGRAALDPGAAATTAAGFAATATTAGTTVAPAAGRPFPYRDESSVTIEDFSGPTSARGAKCRGVLVSRASEGQGKLSARGLNRSKSGIGWGSGHF
jgi:hypothetical protein